MNNPSRRPGLILMFILFIGVGCTQADAENDLTQLRGKIDTIDNQILELLNQRAEVVLEIGEFKKKNDLGVYDPNREKEIEQSLIKMNTGPMPNSSITKIFKTIIEAGRELQ